MLSEIYITMATLQMIYNFALDLFSKIQAIYEVYLSTDFAFHIGNLIWLYKVKDCSTILQKANGWKTNRAKLWAYKV